MGRRATGMAMVLVLAGVLASCGEVGQDGLPRLPVGAGPAGGLASLAEGAAARDLAFPISRIEHRVRGTLPELARSAPAYRLAAEPGAGRVERLARALGLAGDVEPAGGGGWQVADGGRVLRVEPYGGLPWSFGDRSGTVSSGCAVAEPARGGGEDPGRAVEIAPVPPADQVPPDGPVDCPPPEPIAGLPSPAEAERVARALFDEAGAGLDGARAEVAGSDSSGRWVTLRPTLGGIPVIGMDHTAGVGPGGAVTFASGFLARPEELGDYPLVGAAEGFERLAAGAEDVGGPRPLTGAEPAADPASGGPAPDPAPGGPAEPAPDCSSPTVICDPPPGHGDPPPEPEPLVVEVTGAEIVLVLVTGRCPGDPAHLVPSYRFALAEGGFAGPVPAAEESRLDRPDEAVASDDPCPGAGSGDPDGPTEPDPGGGAPGSPGSSKASTPGDPG